MRFHAVALEISDKGILWMDTIEMDVSQLRGSSEGAGGNSQHSWMHGLICSDRPGAAVA